MGKNTLIFLLATALGSCNTNECSHSSQPSVVLLDITSSNRITYSSSGLISENGYAWNIGVHEVSSTTNLEVELEIELNEIALQTNILFYYGICINSSCDRNSITALDTLNGIIHYNEVQTYLTDEFDDCNAYALLSLYMVFDSTNLNIPNQQFLDEVLSSGTLRVTYFRES